MAKRRKKKLSQNKCLNEWPNITCMAIGSFFIEAVVCKKDYKNTSWPGKKNEWKIQGIWMQLAWIKKTRLKRAINYNFQVPLKDLLVGIGSGSSPEDEAIPLPKQIKAF